MKERYESWIGRKADKSLARDLFWLASPALLYFLFYMVWFLYIENHTFPHYAVIHTVADDYIPFREIFVIPYCLWFLYVSLSIAFFMVALDLEDYYKEFLFLATGMTIFLVISTVFPNAQHLRPTAMPRDNIFSSMVMMIYSHDTPTNLWPSIHVYNSIGVMIAIHHSKRFGAIGKTISDVIGVSIILSTLFIKQHSVFDVLTAIIMATICYILFYHTSFAENFLKKREEAYFLRYNS